jgi:hypothetical protein
MPIDEGLAAEGADWIAEQLTEEYGGFIAAEVIDAIMSFEIEIREEFNDPMLPHATMATHLLEKLAAEGAPVGVWGGVNEVLLQEILHLEDEFLAMAGHPRQIR